VVEAAAHARPVIGSDDPGITALAAGLPGLHHPSLRAMYATLATELGRLLNDPLGAARLGQANADAARGRHAPERLAEGMEQIYERAIAARRPHVRIPEVAYSR